VFSCSFVFSLVSSLYSLKLSINFIIEGRTNNGVDSIEFEVFIVGVDDTRGDMDCANVWIDVVASRTLQVDPDTGVRCSESLHCVFVVEVFNGDGSLLQTCVSSTDELLT
jgi:hypothetical protein